MLCVVFFFCFFFVLFLNSSFVWLSMCMDVCVCVPIRYSKNNNTNKRKIEKLSKFSVVVVTTANTIKHLHIHSCAVESNKYDFQYTNFWLTHQQEWNKNCYFFFVSRSTKEEEEAEKYISICSFQLTCMLYSLLFTFIECYPMDEEKKN